MTCTTHIAHRLRQTGLTMIELLITLAVLAILLAIGIPSFEGLLASTRVTNATNELLSAFAQTRSEAIRRGQRVTICISANGAQCTNAGNWNQGWIIFRDAARTGIVATPADILHVSSATANNIVIQGSAALPRFISFSSDGQSRTLAGAIQAGNIEVCSTSSALSDNNRARRLQINGSGQVIMTQPQNPGIPIGCPTPP
ncbi:GspH/FimT family pseudopilin [uncultured Dechloromonas sp.]|uniref:GspH/FimT family pseudopilin n=1 Tax=uncultured Dechloromonas sp. TaxID=171719 RepID=UPI0025DD56F8|nr:GspH/FimT family pseudopilin [uncultured Dechloromonas sp.]